MPENGSYVNLTPLSVVYVCPLGCINVRTTQEGRSCWASRGSDGEGAHYCQAPLVPESERDLWAG
jgi:hypothetical protein